jgi:DNA-binding NarL/FixJ family response regulator
MSSNTTVVGVNIGDSQAAAVDAFALGCTCALDASEGLEVLWYAIVSAAQQDARSALTQLRQAVRRLILYGPPVSSSDLPGLSQREQEITLLIAADLTNKQIAAELNLSVSTVKNHVHNILGKLGVRDRQQAAASLQRRPVDDAIDLAMDRR